jgi:purine nucleoside phosphorylase
MLFTNAAGGLCPEMNVGDLVGIQSAMLWPFDDWPDAPDTTPTTVTVSGCDHYGVYIWVHGPAYETPDEIRLMRRLGGSAVGMSTAPELERCRTLGIPAGAISCITNNCCVPQHLDHAHVLKSARSASERIVTLIRHHIAAVSDQETR